MAGVEQISFRPFTTVKVGKLYNAASARKKLKAEGVMITGRTDKVLESVEFEQDVAELDLVTALPLDFGARNEMWSKEMIYKAAQDRGLVIGPQELALQFWLQEIKVKPPVRGGSAVVATSTIQTKDDNSYLFAVKSRHDNRIYDVVVGDRGFFLIDTPWIFVKPKQ